MTAVALLPLHYRDSARDHDRDRDRDREACNITPSYSRCVTCTYLFPRHARNRRYPKLYQPIWPHINTIYTHTQRISTHLAVHTYYTPSHIHTQRISTHLAVHTYTHTASVCRVPSAWSCSQQPTSREEHSHRAHHAAIDGQAHRLQSAELRLINVYVPS